VSVLSRPGERTALLDALERAFRTDTIRTVMFQQAIASRAGMNLTDLSCLNLLGNEGPLTPGQLADHLGITRGGAITALIDRLETQGHVRRRRDVTDRRRVIVELAEDVALPVIEPLLAGFMQAWTDHLDRYTDQQLELIFDFTTRSNNIVADAIKDLHPER
jgi:DNA-binding MarR family transcriptional regulator